MISGYVTNVGDVLVDGEHFTGMFVECLHDDLVGLSKNVYGMQVVVSPAPAGESQPASTNNRSRAIVAHAADEWFAINNQCTISQAFIAGAEWAQQQQAVR